LSNIDTLIERQRFLESNLPNCPECGSIQSHLLRLNAPAIWVCRKCKHKFTLEPNAEDFNTAQHINTLQDK